MRFTPKSEEELNKEREERMALLKKGKGPFTVLNAETKTAKTDGTEYISLTLSVWDVDGRQKTIKDVGLHPKMMWLIRHFCYAVGLGDKYEMGDIEPDDCMNKSGECEIDIEKGGPNGKGGQYPDKNRIKDFVVASAVRQMPNYQTSKSAQVGGGSKAPSAGGQNQSPAPVEDTPARRAMADAWGTFVTKCKAANMTKDEYTAVWLDAVKDYFRGKPRDAVSEKEWQQFKADDFARPVAPSPIGGDAVFKESEIPF